MKELMLRAERLANERGVFARRRGWAEFMTVKAALNLAIAVWEVEGKRRKAGSQMDHPQVTPQVRRTRFTVAAGAFVLAVAAVELLTGNG